MIYGLKRKITVNLDENLLQKVDLESKKMYAGMYNRIQRSKTIEFMIRYYLANTKQNKT